MHYTIRTPAGPKLYRTEVARMQQTTPDTALVPMSHSKNLRVGTEPRSRPGGPGTSEDIVSDRDRCVECWGWIDEQGAPVASELDAAWAECEAALPVGWDLRVQGLRAYDRKWWIAEAEARETTICDGCGRPKEPGLVHVDGSTPAAALRALAARLREAK